MEHDIGNIGQSMIIKGELRAKEGLTIEGHVDGKVELAHNVLTIGTKARLTAQVLAKTVIVMGTVKGNITAIETINIRETATVDGDLVAPKIGIAEGASVRGQLDMRSPKTPNVLAEDERKSLEINIPSQPAVASHQTRSGIPFSVMYPEGRRRGPPGSADIAPA